MDNSSLGMIFGVLYGIALFLGTMLDKENVYNGNRLIKAIGGFILGALIGFLSFNYILSGWFDNQIIAIVIASIGLIYFFGEAFKGDKK